MERKSLVFGDIEASGLQLSGYPIEVGWAWEASSVVHLRSVLIRPPVEWTNELDSWSEEAERLHGISLEQLMDEGIDPIAACQRLNDELSGKELAFDTGPAAHDSRWLSMLYETATLDRTYSLARLPSDLLVSAYTQIARVPDSLVLHLDRLAPRTLHWAGQDAANGRGDRRSYNGFPKPSLMAMRSYPKLSNRSSLGVFNFVYLLIGF